MNKIGLTLLATAALALPRVAHAQIDASIRLNEVMTVNNDNLQDEYGQRGPWVEIVNQSHSTYNIRGMFVTTDRRALDKKMSAPERMKLMSIIPSGDSRTTLSGRQHIVFHLASSPTRGFLHLAAPVKAGEPTWIAVYNGNGIDLLDSITVPALAPNQSYARQTDGSGRWEVKPESAVTPNISNYIKVSESKIARLKRDDPHGFGITILSMGTVLFCLALLFVFFYFFGMFMAYRRRLASIQPIKATVKTVEKTAEIAHRTSNVLQDGADTKGIDKEIYMAVIAMALKEYIENVHDVESGVITIKPKSTEWNVEFMQMTQFHE